MPVPVVLLMILVALLGIYLWMQGIGDALKVVQLLSAVLGVPALVAALAQWLRRASSHAVPPVDVSCATNVLVDVLQIQWGEEVRIRGLGNPDPIPVPWQLTSRSEIIGPAKVIAEGLLRFSGDNNHVTDLADQFRQLRRRRVVVLGGAGAGKTTLAVQLLLELLATRQDHEPCPVLFSAAGWDPIAYPRFHNWLAVRLRQDYRALLAPELGRDVPEALVERGAILPVIDGLDELPAASIPVAIRALNTSLGDADQLILTCRTDEFVTATRAAGDVLRSAAVIEPQPLTPKIVADHLSFCLPSSPSPAWNRVLTALRNESRKAGEAAGLASVTSTPLGVWLLRSVYPSNLSDPSDVLRPALRNPKMLREHLFEGLIQALVTERPPSNNPAQPFRPQRQWSPDDVRRWLSYIARNMVIMHGGETATSDFGWWEFARVAIKPRVWGLINVGIMTAVLAFWLGPFAWADSDDPVADRIFASVLCEFFTAGLIFGLTEIIVEKWRHDEPGTIDLHGRKLRLVGMSVYNSGLFFGSMMAAMFGFLAFSWHLGPGHSHHAEPYRTAKWILYVLLFITPGISVGFIRWAESPLPTQAVVTPLASWKTDRLLSWTRFVVVAVPSGVVFGLAMGLGVGLNFRGDYYWADIGFAAAIRVGLLAGILGGCISAVFLWLTVGQHSAWIAYEVTTSWLALRRKLPRLLIQFLDDAHRLGLLRANGPRYQFRHAELQSYLARH